MKLARLLILVLVACASAPAAMIFVSNGDSSQLQAINTLTGAISYTATTHTIGYPIAVRDSIWIGQRDNAGQSVEYNLADGTPTGNSATLVGPNYGNFVDGAVNGNVNYTTLAFNGSTTVYQANADWTNPTSLFNIAGGDQFVGITFDGNLGTLWISDRNSIYQYSLAGGLLGSFAHSGDRGSLAWDPGDDTLWYVPNGSSSPLLQYSKAGALLQSLSTPTRSGNIWGAEFQVDGGLGEIPEPATLTLMGAGLAGLYFLRRRKA
jgi:hypothetical protein